MVFAVLSPYPGRQSKSTKTFLKCRCTDRGVMVILPNSVRPSKVSRKLSLTRELVPTSA
ncbi:unnamed protein product [Symbiodinium natans]|uniref:Uncharacterized protein n=1 Tax=Symbiodinium natans TaxID=878477 RepID=A0A812SVV7_9DINO|nr:unnamed protein product [Symbiodinium natans]